MALEGSDSASLSRAQTPLLAGATIRFRMVRSTLCAALEMEVGSPAWKTLSKAVGAEILPSALTPNPALGAPGGSAGTKWGTSNRSPPPPLQVQIASWRQLGPRMI